MARRTWTRDSSTRERALLPDMGGYPLRRMMTGALTFLLVLPLATAAALTLVTTFLHRAATELGDAVESTRILGSMQVVLMADDRAASIALMRGEDPTYGQSVLSTEASLRRLITAAKRYSANDNEVALLERASTTISDYIDTRKELLSGRTPTKLAMTTLASKFGPAFSTVDELLSLDIRDAAGWQERAMRWDRMADRMSMVAAVLAVLGVLVAFYGLRWEVVRPLLALHAAVQAFAAGKTTARATAMGSRELRELSVTFNQLAGNLAEEQRGRLTQLSDTIQAIRDPLTVINLLTTARPESQNPDAALLVRKQVRRIEQVLRDSLDLALIRTGTLDLKIERQDLRAPVRHVVGAFRGDPQCALELLVPDEPIIADCDRARIEHVVITLLCYCVRLSPAGGTITVSLRGEGDHAVIEVADQGVGLSPEACERLFEPFTWTGAPREPFSGAGLGLWATRRIVEAHGGEIEVETAPGEGSTFRVLLPLAVRAEEHDDSTPSALPPRQPGAHA